MKKIFSFLSVFKKIPKKFLVIIILVLLGGMFFVYKKQSTKVPPQLVSVKREDLKMEISASGILDGKESADLKFKVPGKLAYVNVKAGDKIYTGETLAGLDTQDLSIALQQAQNNLRQQQANVDYIHDQVKGNDTTESFTMRNTRTAAEVAKDNAFDSVKAAQRAFQDALITSPLNGIVVKQDPLPGQSVGLTDVIARVVDFSQVVFASDVDESDISNVSLGQKAEITLNTYGDKIFTGKVSDVAPLTHTTSNGATAVTVKVVLDDQTVQHISGLNGQVNIIQNEKDNVLAIPQDALRADDTVIVSENGKLHVVKVTPGFKSDTDVEITSGLDEGQQVVTNTSEVKI